MQKLKIVPPTEKEPVALNRPPALAHRHLVSVHDLTPPEIDYLLKLAQGVKSDPARYKAHLAGRTLA